VITVCLVVAILICAALWACWEDRPPERDDSDDDAGDPEDYGAP
jgi:hypothetical protein